nr:phospholipase-like protein [Tanacetum cinerariifolium]
SDEGYTKMIKVLKTLSSEKIMTMIIKESKELPRELVNLLAMNGKIKNEIASPVRVQLAKKVLKSYVNQLNPDNPEPDMVVASE